MESEVRIERLDPGGTTLIMRGLNRQVTHTSILPLLDGFPPFVGRRAYDFVYVPWATNAVSNIGLAFVNFESHQFCKSFLDALHKPSNRKKLLTYGIRSVGQALIQGRGANLQAILAKRGQAGLADQDAPLVFNRGELASLADVVAREAEIPLESVERTRIVPPTAAETPIPRLVVSQTASQRSQIHLQRPSQTPQGHLVPSASGGYSAGSSGHPNAWQTLPTLQMPLQPHVAQNLASTRSIAPTETSYAYLQQMQALPQDPVGNRLSACIHPMPSPVGPPSFKGGYAGTGSAPHRLTQAVLNPNMAPTAPMGDQAEPGAETWWRIAQTPQLQETAASSLYCFGVPGGPPGQAAEGASRVPHSASRITWDL